MKISIIGTDYACLVSSTCFCQDEYETPQDSDVLIIATEWNQFCSFNLSMRK